MTEKDGKNGRQRPKRKTPEREIWRATIWYTDMKYILSSDFYQDLCIVNGSVGNEHYKKLARLAGKHIN